MLLLREGRAVTPTEMIDAVWGEEAPPRALGALRTLRLPAAHGAGARHRPARSRPELLTSVGRGYALRLPDELAGPDPVRARASPRPRPRAGPGELARRPPSACAPRSALFEGEPLAGPSGRTPSTSATGWSSGGSACIETLHGPGPGAGRARGGRLRADRADRRPPAARAAARPADAGLLPLRPAGRGAGGVHRDARGCWSRSWASSRAPSWPRCTSASCAADPTLAVSRPPRSRRRSPRRPSRTGAGARAAAPRAAAGRRERLHRAQARSPARLRTLLSAQSPAEGVPVAAICGIGGVGKTTLAVHVAHAARRRVPRRPALRRPARLRPTRPTAPESVLGAFLRALGVAARRDPGRAWPSGPRCYRSLLADRRILVLLDNARDAAQVRPLLPGSPGCAALVTSRVRLVDLPAARLVDLDVMEPDEALALFAAVAGRRAGGGRARRRHGRGRRLRVPAAGRTDRGVPAGGPAAPGRCASLVPRLADERRRLDELRVGDLAVEATFALGYGQLEAGPGPRVPAAVAARRARHLRRSRGRRPVD